MNLNKRKILMFRTYHDPSIGPKPRQAFSMKELPNWDMELTQIGVYVRLPVKGVGGVEEFQEHLVPFANVQCIKFKEEAKDDNQKAA